jgi:hypothetical protein
MVRSPFETVLEGLRRALSILLSQRLSPRNQTSCDSRAHNRSQIRHYCKKDLNRCSCCSCCSCRSSRKLDSREGKAVFRRVAWNHLGIIYSLLFLSINHMVTQATRFLQLYSIERNKLHLEFSWTSNYRILLGEMHNKRTESDTCGGLDPWASSTRGT